MIDDSGIVIQLNDGRLCFVADQQPAIEADKVILNLVSVTDGMYEYALDKENKKRCLIRNRKFFTKDDNFNILCQIT